MSDASPQTGLFARRLEHLFDTVRPASGKRYTNPAVANAINEAAGATVISQQYIWHLRKGNKSNPGYTHIAALAGFFGVPAQYFFDDDQATPSSEALDTALQNQATVRDMVFRAAGLSETTLKAIQAMIDNARHLEGLPLREPEEPAQERQ